MGVKGFGGVFNIRARTASRELSGGLGMGTYPDWFLRGPYRPPASDKGENEKDLLHHAVGLIAHNWEHLEGALYLLYTTLLIQAHPQGANLRAYSATFGAVISSATRRDVITAMVGVSFHPDASASLAITPILNLVQRCAGIRNDAVHGLVVRYTRNNKQLGLYVMPPNYVPIPPWSIEGGAFKYRYDCACLHAIAGVIETLRADLLKVTGDLEKGVIGPLRGTPPEPKGPKGRHKDRAGARKEQTPQREASRQKLSKAQARALKIQAAKAAQSRAKKKAP